jgi:uncharacterized SAM-binding protein YcdF (DUF218 family)
MALLYLFSPHLLMIQSQLKSVDAIVVLGGDSGERVYRAAELYAEGLAPFVVASGEGDCRKNRDRLILAQVPENHVRVDCESGSTAENAEYVVRLLRKREIKTAIIVTTWWHTVRAINCFEHFAPEIEFLAVPAHHGEKQPEPGMDEFVEIMIEYVKTVWYAVRHGIS